jgi:hypothetical protein
MTFINIVFIEIYCKMVGHLTNIYCPTVGHLIENLLKKSNAPPMPDPPPLGLNIDRCIIFSGLQYRVEKSLYFLVIDTRGSQVDPMVI